MRVHCCQQMMESVTNICSDHPDRYDCPDALLAYTPKFDEYGLVIHDGGRSALAIAFCPWCGSRLPFSKRDLWFESLKALGVDPLSDDVPPTFQTEAWWSQRDGS